MTFNNCKEGVDYFCFSLEERGMKVIKKEKKEANAGYGRIIMQDVITTETGEIYYLICRPKGRWYPKPTESVSDFAKPLDERLKYIISQFGNGDKSISGLNEDSLLWLIELAGEGLHANLVTLFPATNEILWTSAQDAYDLIMRYGVLPQYSLKGLEGQTMCSIPTGFMRPWFKLTIAIPEEVG